jgi:hypothetical protein
MVGNLKGCVYLLKKHLNGRICQYHCIVDKPVLCALDCSYEYVPDPSSNRLHEQHPSTSTTPPRTVRSGFRKFRFETR